MACRGIGVAALAVWAAVGCGNSSLQGGADAGGPDGPLITSRTSFVVQATFTPKVGGSTAVPASANPSFTLVIVPETRIGIAGHSGVEFTSTDGRSFRAANAFTFDVSEGCQSSISFSDATFLLSANGLAGESTAWLRYGEGDVLSVTEGTASFVGRLDNDGPTLTRIGGADPLYGVAVGASEPIPPQVTLSLAAAGTDPIPLTPFTSTGLLPALSGFHNSGVALRYATAYRVALDGLVDFAGNPTSNTAIEFTTRAAPPLVPEDGFESTADTTLGDGEVVTGAGAIAGNKSLLARGSSFGVANATRFSVRVALEPTDSVLRFAYQLVGPQPGGAGPPTLALGSVGAAPAHVVLNPDRNVYTEVRLDSGSIIYVSAKAAAEIRLPPGSANEIVLQYLPSSSGCGFPPPPAAGVLIDDLRAE
jgi:hypothetical protein